MKKSLVALAVAGAFAAPLTAQADVAISGNVNLKLNLSSQDGDTKKNANVSSGDVRVNFAAQQDVGFGEVFGNIRLDADGLSGTAPETDSVYAGIRGDFGTVTVGDHSVHGNYAGYNWFDTMIGYSDAALVYEAPEFVPGLSIGLQLVGTTYAEKTAVVIDTDAVDDILDQMSADVKKEIEDLFVTNYSNNTIEIPTTALDAVTADMFGYTKYTTTQSNTITPKLTASPTPAQRNTFNASLAVFTNNNTFRKNLGLERGFLKRTDLTSAASTKGTEIANETIATATKTVASGYAKDEAAANANFEARIKLERAAQIKLATAAGSDGEDAMTLYADLQKSVRNYDAMSLVHDAHITSGETDVEARIVTLTRNLQTVLSLTAAEETAKAAANATGATAAQKATYKQAQANTIEAKENATVAQAGLKRSKVILAAARKSATDGIDTKFSKEYYPVTTKKYNEKTETTAFAIGYTRDLGTAGVVKLAYSQATQKVSDEDSHGKQTNESENHIGVGYSNMGFGIAYDQLTKKTKEDSVSKTDTKTTEITLSYATGPVSVNLVSATQKQEKVEETKATVINIDYTLAANTSIRLRNVTSPVTDLAKNTEVKNNSTFIELRQSF